MKAYCKVHQCIKMRKYSHVSKTLRSPGSPMQVISLTGNPKIIKKVKTSIIQFRKVFFQNMNR